jgi:uncharacterized protein with PIN domain
MPEKMIKYDPLYQFYLLECDRCGYRTTITTARTEERVREIAARWGWVFETEQDDLCRRCAGMRRHGVLGRVSELRWEAADVGYEPTGVGRCPRCNAQLEHDDLSHSRYCPSCGWDELAQIVCEGCGVELPVTATVNEKGAYLCDQCARARSR